MTYDLPLSRFGMAYPNEVYKHANGVPWTDIGACWTDYRTIRYAKPIPFFVQFNLNASLAVYREGQKLLFQAVLTGTQG